LNDNPWEEIYSRDGHIFTDVPRIIPEFANLLERNGLLGTRLLDVGCGNGRHLVYFSQRGYQVFGFDSSPSAIRLSQEWLARENLSGNVFQADSRQVFPFPDSFLDVLISTQVIHHALLETVLFTISEITRIVLPGGFILITVPFLKEISDSEEKWEEIEHHTFISLSGTEKGLPHHLFTMEEFGTCFPDFDTLSLSVEGNHHIALIGCKK